MMTNTGVSDGTKNKYFNGKFDFQMKGIAGLTFSNRTVLKSEGVSLSSTMVRQHSTRKSTASQT